MEPDVISRSILSAFDRLTPSEQSLIELVCVYRSFDARVVDYTALALQVDINYAHLVHLPMVEVLDGENGEEFRLRPLLRSHLLERLRNQDRVTFERAHRLAAAYFHQPLSPLNTARLGWYVEEIYHLALSHTERAFSRLAIFSHAALMSGNLEGASRAAAEAVEVEPHLGELTSFAGMIQSVSAILASPARVDERAIVRLDDLLVSSRPATDLAASRIMQLARDLVTYYSERLAPAPRMSTALAPTAGAGMGQRRLPEVSAGLAMAEAVAHFPHTVMKRTHVAELQGMSGVRHSVRTTIYTQMGNDQTPEALIDIFPWDAGDTLDKLDIRDANGWTVDSLKSIQAQSRIASAVSSWLTDSASEELRSEVMSPTVRHEISQSLASALQNREYESIEQLLQTAVEQSDGGLQRRIRSATRYLPLVAVLDANSRASQRLQYHYDGPCNVRREGVAGIEAALELVLPTEVKNHLEIPTPDGLELAGLDFGSELPATLTPQSNRRNWPRNHVPEMPQDFVVSFERDDDENGVPTNRVAKATVNLRYVVGREDLMRVRRVNVVCVLACLAAIFLPFVLNGAVWSNMFTFVASGFVVADAYFKTPRTDQSAERQELRSYAVRPIKLVLAANVIFAVVAASMANVGESFTARAISTASLLACLLLTLVLYGVARQRRRLLARSAISTADGNFRGVR
jgi:hypothetical protein